ncbi:MAG: RNA polymerase sigma factor [Thermomicrobiales bacterium]
MDDDDLIAAVAKGDDTALRSLFERHAPWLAARLRRTLPADVVEDVLQETFLAIWSGAGRYHGDGAVGAWLWGIARRQAAMWARAHGRPIPEIAPTTVSADDPAARAIRTVDLATALAALGPDGAEQRELIRMVYDEDRPLAEVAESLGIPHGTVKSRLFKARHRLRAALLGAED